MSVNTIDTRLLRQMFLCGAENLASNKNWINELNVFPVPDGDTGTNMTMTVVSAVNEVVSLGETLVVSCERGEELEDRGFAVIIE